MTLTQWKNQSAQLAYLQSTGWTIIRSKLASVTFAFKASPAGRVDLKAWRGPTSCNPSFYYTFRDTARAEKHAAEYVQQCQASEAYKANQTAIRKSKRAALNASDHYSVGDVVYTSWGYDQTNVEYYQVTTLKPRSVVVRQISVNSSDHGQAGGGKIAPRRFEFVGPEIFCPLSEDGGFSAGPCWNKDKPAFRNYCHKWDGRACYTSSDR